MTADAAASQGGNRDEAGDRHGDGGGRRRAWPGTLSRPGRGHTTPATQHPPHLFLSPSSSPLLFLSLALALGLRRLLTRPGASITLIQVGTCPPPVMASEQPSDAIETTAPPAVSSLRSRFERLAADSSVPPSHSPKPSTSGTHLSASPIPLSPRLVASPAPDHGRIPSDSSVRSLNPSSSSSDLKAAAKRPPPPPPVLRAPSPANPRRSPLLRPVPDHTPTASEHDLHADIPSGTPKPSSLSRRPPPPPPTQDSSAQRSSGVHDLIKQFG